MMKKHHVIARLLVLLLVFATLLSVFAACGGDDDGGKKKPNKGNTTVTDPILKEFEELDFGDQRIVVSLSKFTSYEIPNESFQYIQGPERVGSDSVLNLVYERNANIENAVNILPDYVHTTLAFDKIAEDISTHVMMPSKDTPDLYVDQIYGLIRAQMTGNLMNVKTKDEANHFDFGEDKTVNKNGWYNAYMNGFNFASDEKMYLLAGDYFMDVIRMLNLTAVNLSDFKEVFYKGDSKRPELGMGTDYLYNTVEMGEWTIDKMIEWSSTGGVYRDDNNNSKKDKDDKLGVMVFDGGASAFSLLPSMDVSLFQVSKDGTQYSVVPSQRAFEAIDAWQRAFRSTGIYVLRTNEAPDGYRTLTSTFIDGDVLFAPGIQLFQLETQELKGMEDLKCVIPYPKLKAEDPYYVFTHDNARVGGILRTTTRFEAVSAWVQAASVSSTKILDEYYNVALKFKESGEFGSATMLDVIYDSICNPKWIVDDAILTVTNNNIEATDDPAGWQRVTADTSNTYSSKYSSQTEKLKTALASYQAMFNALK